MTLPLAAVFLSALGGIVLTIGGLAPNDARYARAAVAFALALFVASTVLVLVAVLQ